MNSNLRFEFIEIESADIGPLNALPDIKNNDYIHAKIAVTDNVSENEKKHIGKGMINTLLPYQIQDGYNRERKLKKFKAAILENEYLKATFIPEIGGRLWSLYNKKANRELLYVNQVFQPANLALRNAWFSGGVEWNVGIKGHNPLTCSPMFAKKIYNDKGDEILRMYEFERIRGIAYRIDAMVKKDSLLVNVHIENTSDEDKYMYWWSNIAVDETEDVRVVTPTDEAYICSYDEGRYLLDKGKMPVNNGNDLSRPVNMKRSQDVFYDIPDKENKWIAAAYKDGKGLLHMSTKELRGRKLFVWGQGKGGRNWNKWLSDGDIPYIEIQAGLLKTQLEHFVMERNSEISFTENYTMLDVDYNKILDNNWDTVKGEVEKNVAKYESTTMGDFWKIIREDALECYGSGWGAFENIVREKQNKDKISKVLDFPFDSLNEEQQEWIKLLKENTLCEKNTDIPPLSYVTSSYLKEILENDISNCENWYSYMQLGVMRYAKEDVDGAFDAFKKSVSLKENPWSLRNLAMIYLKEKNDIKNAVAHIKRAVELKPDYRGLLVNCAEILINAQEYSEWINIFDSLKDNLKNDGRLKMMSAICYIRLGMLDMAKSIVNENFVMNDIKEGEFSISKIWVELYKEIMKKDGINVSLMNDSDVFKIYPLPQKLDFRMHE